MQKKTLKIFVNSFAVSLFVIWTANELFIVPGRVAGGDVTIPEKNIALFFRDEAQTVNYSASTPVKTFSLAALAPRPLEREVLIDEGLFVFDEDEEAEEPGFKISSVEDAADIPLEESPAVQKPANSVSDSLLSLNDNRPEKRESTFSAAEKTQTVAVNSADTRKPETKPAEAKTTENNSLLLSANDFIEETIPLEFGSEPTQESKVEIASHAPENQIAMADGGKIDLDAIAVDKENEKTDNAGSEWYQMKDLHPEADNPWVVAKGTRNPRNNQVLDEKFYNGLNEEEIAAILDKPKPMAEEGEEVQVAEMVKNILIPIPEDILNDKNLTPQLVSPKKSEKYKEKEDAVSEETDNGGTKESGGLLKSIASMFTGGDESATESGDDVSEEEVGDERPKKRGGLFSVFNRGKAPAKILPAEMRLSFQPGRAEISGSTLRWIEAFANKVNEDPTVILEIRIDRTSSFALQQKRLNLLHNILTNKGVDYGKINTVFTNREPNSFIIRTLRIGESNDDNARENERERAMYYQSW